MILKTLIASIILLTISQSVLARNDYLNGQSWQQCNKGTISTYGNYNQNDNTNYNGQNYPGRLSDNSSNFGGSQGDSQQIGINFTWFLGSNCTDEVQDFMFDSMKINRQLELAKMCQRYKHKELPDNFAELRSVCAGFPDDIENEHRPPEGSGSYYDELLQEIKDGKHPDKNPKKYHSDDVKVPFQDSLKLKYDGKDTKTHTLKIPKGLDRPRGTDEYGLPLPYTIPEPKVVFE